MLLIDEACTNARGGTMKHRLLFGLTLATTLTLPIGGAKAQVPPHYPGTICFTPYFWCWSQPPGPPNTACACPSPQGWVPGTRG